MAQSSKKIFDIKGTSIPSGAFVVLLYTAWNRHVVQELLNGAKKVLDKKKGKLCPGGSARRCRNPFCHQQLLE